MTPEEVQEVAIDDYITPLWQNRAWSRGAAHVLHSYALFADFTYPLVEELADKAQARGEAKIGYIKARATTDLWERSGGNPHDPGYVAALEAILRNCRLSDAAKHDLSKKIAPGNSAITRISPTQPTENTTMHNSSSQAFTTVSYVYGRPVKDLSEAELINAIKGVEAEMIELGKIQTPSKKIEAKVAELNGMLTSIVAALDAK